MRVLPKEVKVGIGEQTLMHLALLATPPERELSSVCCSPAAAWCQEP